MEFRKDINGLRAWAVIFVVLFHFDIAGFSGGFIGVDLFFVISGFLMTGIIVTGLIKSDFNFWKFIYARIRRILPALFVLCVAAMIFGWFVLDDASYIVLMRHVGASLLFGSNFKYWREAGYFDDASHEKLLLHTWSLSVEWQFYMLLPLVLMFCWLWLANKKNIIYVIIFLFAVSFFCSVYLSAKDPVGSFFLLHTRAWEMLAGGLVYFFSQKLNASQRSRNIFGYLGMALVVFSIFLLDPADVWPGYLALIPVFGVSLIILFNVQIWLFNNKFSQWIGSSSYSIYLWHWPLAAIINFSEGVTIYIKLLFIIFSFVLGFISFKWVEIPAKNAFVKVKNFGWYVLVGIFLLILAGWVSSKYPNVDWRIPNAARMIYSESQNINPDFFKCQLNINNLSHECRYGGDELGVIVIGDSHASSVIRSVEKALPDTNLHVLDWSQAGCSTVMGLHPVSGQMQHCEVEKLYEASKKYDAHVPMLIVNRLAANFHGRIEKAHALPDWYIKTKYQEDIDLFQKEIHDAVVETACKFAQQRPVYMLRHIPELTIDVPAAMGRTMAIFGEYRRISITYEEYMERTALVRKAQDAAAESCGVKILDPTPYLCENGRCWGDFDGHPIYQDDDHLSERGAARLVPEFRKIFN